jgi:EAL domain-containing protein (putative c-di-GMP-specific phosphodiesterase class I)
MLGALFSRLEDYLSRLSCNGQTQTRVWAHAEGRAQGRYFNSTLTSAFQPIRALHDGAVIGHEGFARSYSEADPGLCVWKLLDHAASDDESVALDRLCRMLHAMNFFRQPEAGGSDLYLSVHARLMAAVDGNHGAAFGRVLEALELPRERIVLQLPVVTRQQNWLLDYVADNYRRNGFRIAVNVPDATEALTLVERMRPAVVKIDAREIGRDEPVLRLLAACDRIGVRAVFKRVESMQVADALKRIAAQCGKTAHVQGFLHDLPTASLGAGARLGNVVPPLPVAMLRAGAA